MSQEEKQLDFFDMSDEDFLKKDYSDYPVSEQEEEEVSEESSTEDSEQEEQEETLEEVEQEESNEPDEGTFEGSDDDTSESGESDESEESTDPADEGEKEEASTTAEKDEVDYKAVYDKLFAPFRANGKEMRIESVDDAIALMQMGANYNKKMAALKPNLKMLKLLENNGLLDESKLGFLIDLDKKDPAAITKLIKDSGIDPLDVDVDKANEYAPKTYTVDDRELALDEVLNEIQDTPSFSKTLKTISNKWDASSKQVLAETPQLLKVINDHVANGIYDLISNEIERERMFGRLEGLSDIQAYQRVGDALNAQGKFDHLVQGSQPEAPKKVVATKLKAKRTDPKLVDKKRAASSPKAAPSQQTKEDFNPLAMPDEEFSNLVNTRFL